MPKAKSDCEIVTHDELIELFRECKRARFGAPEAANACRNRLECKFKAAITEAQTMGVLTVDLLFDLQRLVDPRSGESIFPPTLEMQLEHTIAHFKAIEKKRERRVSRQITEARA